jgi:hypothetical protein
LCSFGFILHCYSGFPLGFQSSYTSPAASNEIFPDLENYLAKLGVASVPIISDNSLTTFHNSLLLISGKALEMGLYPGSKL